MFYSTPKFNCPWRQCICYFKLIVCYLDNVLTDNKNHPVFKSSAMSCCVERIAVMTKTMCVTLQQSSPSIATHLFYTHLYPTPIYFGTIMRCTRREIRQRMVLAVLRLKFKILKSIQNSMISVIYKWVCDYLRTWIQLSKGRKAKTLTQEIHIFPEVLSNKCMWGYVEYFCSMTEVYHASFSEKLIK